MCFEVSALTCSYVAEADEVAVVKQWRCFSECANLSQWKNER